MVTSLCITYSDDVIDLSAAAHVARRRWLKSRRVGKLQFFDRLLQIFNTGDHGCSKLPFRLQIFPRLEILALNLHF